jgi:hypothetical protein
MNTSIRTRIAAALASILVTLGTIYLIARYAYPEQPAVLVALATPR